MYSKKNKILFIHPQKCAGSSIKRSLRKTFGYESFIPNAHDKETKPDCGHWTLSQFDYYLEDDLKEFFKFSVVRNPWDRAVSYYFYLVTKQNYKKTFGLFCNDYYLREDSYQLKQKLLLNKRSVLDFIIRFENLEEDFKIAMSKMGIQDFAQLEKLDHNTGRRNRDYRPHYNERTKNIVADLCEWEIKKFGYKF